MGRKSIGIVYTPNPNWMGGVYYIQNLVKSLLYCEDRLLPRIHVFCYNDTDFKELQQATSYPYLKKRIIWSKRIPSHFIIRAIRKVTGIDLDDYERFPTRWDRLKFVYYFGNIGYNQAVKSKCLGWIPDFQEKYLPELFSQNELEIRNSCQQSFIQHNVPIVFSSEDARNDFFKFHPDGNHLRTWVLPFAVQHPDYSQEDIGSLKRKFGINKQYLFCANQFWTHKNHLFLFKAFLEAKKKGLYLQLVCSGRLHDYRNNGYADEIRNFIKDNNLENDILILGFIERTEQLCLMQNSYAIVQPSLFEGWSTVVEDAKCLNKFIFLSDLRVHREQAPKEVCYFDPQDEEDLSEKLLTVIPTKTYYDYSRNIQQFGKQFLTIIDEF